MNLTKKLLRLNVLELLNNKTVYYDGNFRKIEKSIPCSVTFRHDENDFYVEENETSYSSLNKAVTHFYREYFRKNNLEIYSVVNTINVWSTMRDENGKTVDEMLAEFENDEDYRDEELYQRKSEILRNWSKNGSYSSLSKGAPDTRMVGQSKADYEKEQRENMRYCRKNGLA